MEIHKDKKATKTFMSKNGKVQITTHGEINVELVANFFIKTLMHKNIRKGTI